MNSLINLLIIIVCGELTLEVFGCPKLTALNHSLHARRLYLEIKNRGNTCCKFIIFQNNTAHVLSYRRPV